jgi:PAS domain S-box-containing protein
MSSQALPAPAKQLFHYLFEQASLGIAVEDLEGRLLLANPALCSMLGYTESELRAMSCSQFADPEDSEEDWAQFQKLRAGVIDHYSLEKRYVRKDGTRLWGRLNVSLLKDAEGGSPVVFAFVEDITERKQAEQDLTRTNESLRLALEAGKLVAWDWDVQSGRDSLLGDLQTMFGLPSNRFDGRVGDFQRHVHPDDRKMVAKAVADARQSRNPYVAEFRVVRTDGTVRWVSSAGQFYYGPKGDPERMLGIAADITERKQAEQRLQEYEKAVECSEDSIAVVDREYRYVIANRKFLALRNMTKEQVVGRLLPDILNKGVFEAVAKDKLDECFSGKVVTFELRYTYPALGERDLSLSYFPIRGVASVDRVACIARDITEQKRVEKALNKSEERLRLAAQAGKMFAYEWDAATDVITRSEGVAQILGVSEGACTTGQQILTMVPSEDRERLIAAIGQLTPKEPHLRITHRMVRSDGNTVCVERTSRGYFDEHGKMLRLVGMIADITERKRAEEALKTSEEKFSKAFRQSPMALTLTSAIDHRYLDVNETFEEMTGWRRDEVIGRPPFDIGIWADPAQSLEFVKRVLAEGAVRGSEVHYRTKDGTQRVGLGAGELIQIASEPCILSVIADITERKQIEEALRQREVELTEAQRLAGVGSWQWEPRTDTVTWSRELYHLMGVDPTLPAPSYEEHAKLFTAESWERLQRAVQGALQTGTSYELDLEVVRPESIAKWEIARGEAVRDAGGQIIGLRGTVQDITERKRAEIALRESQERLSLAVQAGRMYAFDWDLVTDVITRSKESIGILNWTDSERDTGREFHARIRPDDRALYDATEAGLTPENPNYQISFRTLAPDGREAWLEDTGRASFDAQGKMVRVIGIVSDITERKGAEEALRESQDKLRLILDSTAEAIYGIDLAHRCTFCNPACLRMLGYEHVYDVLGKNIHSLIHHTRADGTLFPVEECRVHHFQTGEGAHAEDDFFWRADGTSFPVEYWSYPQRKGQDVIGAVVAFIDITDRKRAEAALAKVSSKLIEAQEQERSRIGGELHDDIGQRLALLAVGLQQLKENSAILPEARGRVGELYKQTSEIAADVQSLSHELHSAKLQYLGIVSAVRGFCREFSEQQKVEVSFESHNLPAKFSADVSLSLFRVLQEALHNSAKHSGARHFEVRLWGTADEIHLTVRDSGAGFDREAARTSRGLGLVSMEERLKLVHGTLSIESQPKGGTIVHARVPVSAGTDSMRAAG